MVKCVYPVTITSSITLDRQYDTYNVNPTTNIIITIPINLTIGTYFRIRRAGSNFAINVLIQPSGSDQIVLDSTTNTINYPLNPLNYVELTYTKEGFWYARKLIMSDPRISNGILTTNFIENSSNPYLTINNSSFAVSYFYHQYSTRGAPTYLSVSVLYVTGTVDGVLEIYTGTISGAVWTPSISPHMSMIINLPSTSSGYYHFDTTTIVNTFPTTDNLTQVRWTRVGGSTNQKAGLNSIYLY